MKKLLLILALCLFSSGAFAQCNGIFPPNYVCGNASGVPAPPEAFDASSLATSSLVVGTTQIKNGTNTYVEFNQNGVLGEYLIPPGFSGFGTAAGASIGTSLATLGLLNANKTDSGIDIYSNVLNITGTLEVGGVAALPWSVSNGGTGAATFTSGVPILGNGTSPFTSGTKTGNTTLFATSNGALVNGDCVSIDSNGNLIDAGGPCTTGGGGGTVTSGTAGQIAYYAASGATVVGLSLDSTLQITGGNLGFNLANANTWTGNVKITTNNSNLALDTPAINELSSLTLSDHGTSIWSFINFGNASDVFEIFDATASRSVFTATPNGNLALMPVAGNVGIGSGATSPSGLLQVSAAGGTTSAYFGKANASGAQLIVAGGSSGSQTWVAPFAATGTITFPSATTTLPGLSLNNSWAGNNYFGGGAPWVDVKSGANGCAAAAGNGSTNDRAAIQCQINWVIANYPFGIVFFPCGTYLINGGGIDQTNGGSGFDPFLQGESVGCTIIETTDDETAVTLGNFTSSQSKPGMDSIFVNCSFSNPTTNCVVISSGPVDIRNSTIQGGRWALVNHGTDGTIFNSFIANIGGIQGSGTNCNPANTPSNITPLTACYGNLYTDGANWYIRDKFDQNAVQDISIYITTTGSGGVTENSFGNTDSSDNARNSLAVFDNGSNHAITTWYGYGPLSTPIYIRSAGSTLISNSNMNGGTSNSPISITGTICGATITGSGSKQVAGNIGTC